MGVKLTWADNERLAVASRQLKMKQSFFMVWPSKHIGDGQNRNASSLAKDPKTTGILIWG